MDESGAEGQGDSQFEKGEIVVVVIGLETVVDMQSLNRK